MTTDELEPLENHASFPSDAASTSGKASKRPPLPEDMASTFTERFMAAAHWHWTAPSSAQLSKLQEAASPFSVALLPFATILLAILQGWLKVVALTLLLVLEGLLLSEQTLRRLQLSRGEQQRPSHSTTTIELAQAAEDDHCQAVLDTRLAGTWIKVSAASPRLAPLPFRLSCALFCLSSFVPSLPSPIFRRLTSSRPLFSCLPSA